VSHPVISGNRIILAINVIIQKLPVAQVVYEFLACYGIRSWITVFTRACTQHIHL